jgi:hypothetical protein
MATMRAYRLSFLDSGSRGQEADALSPSGLDPGEGGGATAHLGMPLSGLCLFSTFLIGFH